MSPSSQHQHAPPGVVMGTSSAMPLKAELEPKVCEQFTKGPVHQPRRKAFLSDAFKRYCLARSQSKGDPPRPVDMSSSSRGSQSIQHSQVDFSSSAFDRLIHVAVVAKLARVGQMNVKGVRGHFVSTLAPVAHF